ncbi:ABC transporter permease subunit, partial [Candidatus Bipolaricaulota bacterium]|nr:ABC transporter permease subunit [Candidatus Bipolaricaulota bacterium]
MVLLGTLIGVSIYVTFVLLTKGMYVPAAMPLIGSVSIAYIFLTEKRYPLRWLVPGLIFLIVMVVYPIGYTVVSSFTNVGTGHMLAKDQAIDQLLDRSFAPADALSYTFTVFAKNANNDLALLLESGEERILYLHGEATAVAVDDPRLIDDDGDGEPDRFTDFARLSIPQIVPMLSTLETYRIEFESKTIGLESLTEFRTRTPTYVYDADAETMIDQQTGIVYTALEGIFTDQNGEEIYPGYKVKVGIRNYINLLTNPRIAGPFAMVFLWTFAFAFLTVLLNFGLGLSTAILLNDPYLRFRTLYRVVMIIPYAIPAFVTILVWRGMLNQHFGIINKMIVSSARMIDSAVNYIAVHGFNTTAVLFGDVSKIGWLADGTLAKISVLLVNLWLGYPYMMLICLGALQSIPKSLYEAARVDGASWWQQFRNITLPLLLMPLAPLLVGAFAFNFNNFTLIWLLTEGRPAIAGATTPAGQTD